MALITRAPSGHRCGQSHPRAKASDEVVRRAREMRERKHWGYAVIGAELGVSWNTVRDWCEYRTRANA